VCPHPAHERFANSAPRTLQRGSGSVDGAFEEEHACTFGCRGSGIDVCVDDATVSDIYIGRWERSADLGDDFVVVSIVCATVVAAVNPASDPRPYSCHKG
jgi:hypothetical protein